MVQRRQLLRKRSYVLLTIEATWTLRLRVTDVAHAGYSEGLIAAPPRATTIGLYMGGQRHLISALWHSCMKADAIDSTELFWEVTHM